MGAPVATWFVPEADRAFRLSFIADESLFVDRRHRLEHDNGKFAVQNAPFAPSPAYSPVQRPAPRVTDHVFLPQNHPGQLMHEKPE